MLKNKFIKSTFILVIGGALTKLLGMIIKIITTRIIGTEGIGIYMLIMPTFNLFIALCQLGFPIAVSKLVSEDRKNNKRLMLSVITISIILNIALIIIIFLLAPIISNTLIHEERTFYPILAISLVLPFISISSIVRGYFFGKQKMFPHTLGNVFEQIVRLGILVIILPILAKRNLTYAVTFMVLVNIISEFTSIIIMLLFLPKNFKITKKDLVPNKRDVKDVLQIGIPTTGSRIISSIGYFLEPIILTSILLSVGYNNNYIVYEYGIVTGYILPTLAFPSFFTMAISQALIPVVSNSYANEKKDYTKKKIKQGLFFSCLIGIPITIILMLYPERILTLIYNTNEGLNYMRVLTPIFFLSYIQAPLTSSLQAMGKAKTAMIGTFIGISLKILLIFILSSLKIGMWGYIIASIINVLFITIYDGYNVKKCLQ